MRQNKEEGVIEEHGRFVRQQQLQRHKLRQGYRCLANGAGVTLVVSVLVPRGTES